MSKHVAAIVVNWNGGPLAVEGARSIICQTSRPTLWVVDNASTDGSGQSILRSCPGVKLLANTTNVGYAAANNQAMQLCGDADFLLLINNDVILPQDYGLANLIEIMDENPSIAGICGRYEYPDGDFQRFYMRLPRPLDLAVNLGFLRHLPGLLKNRRNGLYHLLDLDDSKPGTIEQPGFSCVFLRGSCARRIGFLDERFPIFFNDVDYCWRWREQGWTWHYRPEWRIIHHKSRSTSRMGDILQPELASSAVRFARKHFSSMEGGAVAFSIALEALWRRYRHHETAASASKIFRGDTFFAEPKLTPSAVSQG